MAPKLWSKNHDTPYIVQGGRDDLPISVTPPTPVTPTTLYLWKNKNALTDELFNPLGQYIDAFYISTRIDELGLALHLPQAVSQIEELIDVLSTSPFYSGGGLPTTPVEVVKKPAEVRSPTYINLLDWIEKLLKDTWPEMRDNPLLEKNKITAFINSAIYETLRPVPTDYADAPTRLATWLNTMILGRYYQAFINAGWGDDPNEWIDEINNVEKDELVQDIVGGENTVHLDKIKMKEGLSNFQKNKYKVTVNDKKEIIKKFLLDYQVRLGRDYPFNSDMWLRMAWDPVGGGSRKRNTRKRNTRKRNTRKRNTRKRNTRKRNTRKRNTRKRNTRKRNTRKRNTRKRNTRKRNTRKRSVAQKGGVLPGREAGETDENYAHRLGGLYAIERRNGEGAVDYIRRLRRRNLARLGGLQRTRSSPGDNPPSPQPQPVVHLAPTTWYEQTRTHHPPRRN